MVIPDGPERTIPLNERTDLTNKKSHWARPVDRLGAVVIDLGIILLPVILFIIAPFKKIIIESLILHNEAQLTFAIIVAGVFVVLIHLLYQAVTTTLWGGSLGKLFFGLKVVSVWDQNRLSFLAAFSRAWFWLLEALCLGIPFLTVFSNDRRRPFHDRLVDAEVISDKYAGVNAPTVMEASFVRGIFAAFIGFIILVFAVNFARVYKQMNDELRMAEVLEEEGELCSSVGEALSTWPKDDSTSQRRLGVAMTLFAAGEISKKCLAEEVAFILSRPNPPTALSYLAKAFVHSEDSMLSDSYLSEVCKVDTKATSCTMAKVVEAWSSENWEDVDRLFSGLPNTKDLYISIWMIRHQLRQERYEDTLRELDAISPQRSLGSFLTASRVKALWNMSRLEESRAAAAVAFDHMHQEDSLTLSAWLCREEQDQGCSAVNAKSCQNVTNEVGKPDFFEDPGALIAYLRSEECKKGKSEIYDELLDRVRDRGMHELLKAAQLQQLGQINESNQMLIQILENKKYDDSLHKEALRRSLLSAQALADLQPLENYWQQARSPMEWRKVGKWFLQANLRLGSYTQAFKIGQKLYQRAPQDAETHRALIVSAYHLGYRKDAWSLLQTYQEQHGWSDSKRTPASDQEAFSVIARVLNQEFLSRRK